MAIMKKNEIVLDHKFDPVSCRHTMNGWFSVLHCHHYTSLYTQLADDCGFLDAKKLLAEVAEENFFEMLVSYFEEYDIQDIEDRISIAEQYYAAIGLGKLKVTFAGPDSGNAMLEHSHIDLGWIKKWGKREEPVNFITCGYISALLSAVFDFEPRRYHTKEVESIVAGSDVSRFNSVAY